jgi:hypothetical protein
VTGRGGDYSEATTVIATPSTVGGPNPTAVQADLRGLRPGVLYFYRVVAASRGWTDFGVEHAFIRQGHRVLLPVVWP